MQIQLIPVGLALCTLIALQSAAAAQQVKIYRIGVIHQGGPYKSVLDGFRDGLAKAGYKEGKDFIIEVRDLQGDLKAAEAAGKVFEQNNFNSIYAITSSVAAAVKNVTAHVPIVFAVGSDPIRSGLVQSLVKPGGRLTGVEYSTTDLTGKRLEILKEILPSLSRVLTIYNPLNRNSNEAARLARRAAPHFGVKVVERYAISVEELRKTLEAIKTKEADGYFYITDAMVIAQAQLVLETMTVRRLPTMFSEQSLVAMGALASYGQNFIEIGRLSAKYIQKLMTGGRTQDLRVERVDKFELAVNLKTAKLIGLAIPPDLLARADPVIR